MMSQKRQPPINPKYIVIDEADLLLEIDKNVSNYTFRLINEICEKGKKTEQSPQFAISASSFPKKIGK